MGISHKIDVNVVIDMLELLEFVNDAKLTMNDCRLINVLLVCMFNVLIELVVKVFSNVHFYDVFHKMCILKSEKTTKEAWLTTQNINNG